LLTVTMLSEWPKYFLTETSSHTTYVAWQPMNQCSSNFAPSLVAALEICRDGGFSYIYMLKKLYGKNCNV
jgi:hypothetical protein